MTQFTNEQRFNEFQKCSTSNSERKVHQLYLEKRKKEMDIENEVRSRNITYLNFNLFKNI